MRKKDITLYYGLIMAIYSVAYVAMSAFSSVYLLHIGMSNGGVGILLALGSLIAAFCQPFIGSLIDHHPKVTSRGFLLVIAITIEVLGLVIMFVPGKTLAVEAVLYGVCIMLLMLAQPFLNSLGMDALNYGYPLNLGLGRGMGSLGYALASYVFGFVSVLVGPSCIPVAFSAAFLVLCIFLFFYPVRGKGEIVAANQKATDESEKSGAFFKRYKRFAGMLIGMVFVYFSHSLINTFALQIVVSKNGTSADMGTATSIAAFCELITTILFFWYMKKIKLSNILKIACVFFTLKIFFSFLVPNVGLFFLIQGFQMFGWGFMSVGLVYYVNNLMGNNDKAQGQAYAGQAFTIACVLATFLGGNIIDLFGVNAMLIIGTIAAAIGTVIVWFTVEDKLIG